MSNNKQCTSCNELKPLGEFHRSKCHRLGRAPRCKECQNRYRRRRHRERDSEQHRRRRAKSRYGITDAEYDLANGVTHCELCNIKLSSKPRKKNSPTFDHCHVSNKFRGVVCNSCNLALGLAKDSVPVLKAMVKYLEAHKSKS